MVITLNKLTALRILRSLRSGLLPFDYPQERCDLFPPNPSPRKRWTKSAIDLGPLADCVDYSQQHPLDVAVGHAAERLYMREVSCTVYSRGLPESSFAPVCDGVAISSPELLFVELARVMDIPQHVLLGMELCGSFSRSPSDPRDGEVTFGIQPVTSVEKLRAFCDSASGIWGLERARESLRYVRDNAWAPTEAIIATMLLLPLYELGYGFNDVVLNERVITPETLRGSTGSDSRVPDLRLVGCDAGINYDGGLHLDLDSVVSAAMRSAQQPTDEDLRSNLAEVKRMVRSKVVDDLRRNRELLADGMMIIPLTKEDVSAEGGLDTVVQQLIAVAERSGLDCYEQRKILRSPVIARGRQKLIWSLLPGERGRRLGRLLAERRHRVFVPIVYGYELMLGPSEQATTSEELGSDEEDDRNRCDLEENN